MWQQQPTLAPFFELTSFGSPSMQAELSNPLEALEHYCRSHLAFQRLAYSQVSPPLTKRHGACTSSCRMSCLMLCVERYAALSTLLFRLMLWTSLLGAGNCCGCRHSQIP
jgi:hypothetical protein